MSGIAWLQKTDAPTALPPAVTITDTNGDTLCFASAGTVGFKGSRKSTPYAAQMAAEDAGNPEWMAVKHRQVAAAAALLPQVIEGVRRRADEAGEAELKMVLSCYFRSSAGRQGT